MLIKYNAKDLFAMEILSLACALIDAMERREKWLVTLGGKPTPISDAMQYARMVADLVALELVDDVGNQDLDVLTERAKSVIRLLRREET